MPLDHVREMCADWMSANRTYKERKQGDAPFKPTEPLDEDWFAKRGHELPPLMHATTRARVHHVLTAELPKLGYRVPASIIQLFAPGHGAAAAPAAGANASGAKKD